MIPKSVEGGVAPLSNKMMAKNAGAIQRERPPLSRCIARLRSRPTPGNCESAFCRESLPIATGY